MGNLLPRSCFTLCFMLSLLTLQALPGSILAKDCGGPVPCECGDTLVASRTLSGVDPITTTVCPGDGLVVEGNNLTLDLGGHTIQGGPSSGVGVVVDGLSSSDIRGGTVSGFEFGIQGFEVRSSHISSLRLLDNRGVGLDLCCQSTANVIEHLLIEGGGLAVRINDSGRGGSTLRSMTIRHTEGIVASGGIPESEGLTPPGNVLVNNRIEDTRGDGMVVRGFRNIIARNVVIRSAGDGIVIAQFGNNTVNNNQVTFSGGHGLRFEGREHTVFRNVAKNNGGDGLFIGATASTFDRNQSLINGGFGIEDATQGNGTADTANIYTLNICYGSNVLGKSSPEGLCR